MCLGLNQGSMSSAFNYYPMCNVGSGTWIGEESFFMETTELSYSIKTVSTVKVLEIGLVDFYDKMPPEIIKNLRTIALKKQFSKIMRMNEATFGNPISVAKDTTWMNEIVCVSSINVTRGTACMKETAIINSINSMSGTA